MTCRLCLLERPLAESHIIPEFLYKPLYDEKHRFFVTSTDSECKDRREQKGLREKLLCSGCEGKLSEWEGYAANLWARNAPKPGFYDNAVVFQDIDYRIFKLFQMSLIWRCSISSLPEFENIKLGLQNPKHPLNFTKHEESIRNMLWCSNPGEPHQYGCAIFYSPKLIPKLQDGIISGSMSRFQGHGLYRIFIQGTFWIYSISSHMQQFPFKGYCLQKNGDLPIIKEHSLLNNWLGKFYSDLKNDGKV